MLVANIPWHAGDSMARVYDADATSVAAWLAQFLIFDQRFMPIFCMLFGASAVLLKSRYKATSGFETYFLKRMSILLVIGIAHAYLLWPGDILITYAVCSPVLLLVLERSPRWLIVAGILLKCIDVVFSEWPQVYDATLNRVLFSWWVDYGPAPSTIVEAYAGSYSDLFAYNAWRNQFLQWTALPDFRVWNALGFMLIGIALFKLQVLQGARSDRFYRRMLWSALAVGLPLVLYGVLARVGINATVGPYLSFTTELPLKNLSFSLGCAVSSFAVLGGAQLFFKHRAGVITVPIERVGRMALTNYLMHSVLFIAAFHSWNLLPFDALDHDALLVLVLATWVLQLVGSGLWLSVFNQGPVEAVWRKTTQVLVN